MVGGARNVTGWNSQCSWIWVRGEECSSNEENASIFYLGLFRQFWVYPLTMGWCVVPRHNAGRCSLEMAGDTSTTLFIPGMTQSAGRLQLCYIVAGSESVGGPESFHMEWYHARPRKGDVIMRHQQHACHRLPYNIKSHTCILYKLSNHSATLPYVRLHSQSCSLLVWSHLLNDVPYITHKALALSQQPAGHMLPFGMLCADFGPQE